MQPSTIREMAGSIKQKVETDSISIIVTTSPLTKKALKQVLESPVPMMWIQLDVLCEECLLDKSRCGILCREWVFNRSIQKKFPSLSVINRVLYYDAKILPRIN